MSGAASGYYTYEEARREARRILGDKAELRHVKKAPVYQYHVGILEKGRFIPLGVGSTWKEAIYDIHQRGGRA